MGIFITLVILLVLVVGGYIFVKNTYPLHYEEEILEYSQEFGLDPYFVAAVIWTESKFQANAESSQGAIGLMQIMPDTGNWIAEKLDMGEQDEDTLVDPDVNIRLGCWYLSYLMDKFDGDLTKVMAGYNAGPNRVEQWLQDPEYSSDGTSLETIPYEETENYVKRIQTSYKIYQFLYDLG